MVRPDTFAETGCSRFPAYLRYYPGVVEFPKHASHGCQTRYRSLVRPPAADHSLSGEYIKVILSLPRAWPDLLDTPLYPR